MLATCEHASGQGGMYVYDVYLQGMWSRAAICPLVVEEKNKNKNKKKTTDTTQWEIYLKNGGKFGEDYTKYTSGKKEKKH